MNGVLAGGRYVLQEVMGHGGSAVVWQAFDQALGRPVAVKMLDRVDVSDGLARQRFDREARLAAGLSHPNIVAVHDIGAEGDVPYLVMELIDGISLATVLTEGPMHTEDAIIVAIQVCQALRAAHEAGIVHRDIKPGNVLLASEGVVKVCDFGIARLVANTETLTRPRHAVGTGAFMSPEQITGMPVDARTDLYSLGCLMYAMFIGAPPFTATSPGGLAYRQVH